MKKAILATVLMCASLSTFANEDCKIELRDYLAGQVASSGLMNLSPGIEENFTYERAVHTYHLADLLLKARDSYTR